MKSALALLATAALLGCAGAPPRTDVDARDGSALAGTLRVSRTVGAADPRPSVAQDGLALELGLWRAGGEGTQALAAGEPPVEYAGRLFTGPQTLRHDFDLTFADLSARWRHFFGGGSLGVELLAGLSYAGVGLEVAVPGQRVDDSLDSYGGILAAGLLWRLLPATSLQSRVTFYASFDGWLSKESDETENRFELALVHALGRHASLRAGFAYTKFEADRGAASTLNLTSSGPLLGLELHF